jgi:hypothetical protein
LNCKWTSIEQSTSTSGKVNANGQALTDGAIWAFNQGYGLGAGTVIFNTNATNLNYGNAFVQNVVEESSGIGPLLDLCDTPCTSTNKNWVFFHNTLVGERTNRFYNSGKDSGDSTYSNWFAQINIASSFNFFTGRAVECDWASTGSGTRTGNWGATYAVGWLGDRVIACTSKPCDEGNTWLGNFSGLYQDYNPSQVTGTDSNAYVCILANTASSSTDPITGGNYASYWSKLGSTGGDSCQTWTSGYRYEPLNFISDASLSTGTGAGGGNYRLTSGSSLIGFYPCSLDPIPYDLNGVSRSGNCTAGAYEYPAPRHKRTQ